MNLIVAKGLLNEIGEGNRLLWRLPSDLKFFKKTTQGHTVVMGRKTWESIGSKPLAKRNHVVITRNPHRYKDTHNVRFMTAEQYKSEYERTDHLGEEIFIIGGAEIYKEFAEFVNVMYITEVENTFPNADTFFTFPKGNWTRKDLGRCTDDEFSFRVRRFERVKDNV